MNINWLMRIMKYILSLIHFFYIGIIAVILLILGINSPLIRMVGLLVLISWFIVAAIEQIIFGKIMKENPEFQEIVNSMMANETNLGRVLV